ncbi:MAG: relaxase domain-containing protein [Verrucomicrobia bacterium]|nr:relaxase domain-containing protein [Verrucomicrobiota bacterium]
MLSISNPIKTGSPENYYLNLACQKYYTAEFERPGKWFGLGAEPLSLQGTVKEQALRNLFNGFSPDGTRPLVQNAGGQTRTKGWDLTFSAPKSVSTLWAIAPTAVRQEVERAHRQAVEATLTRLERSAGVARRGSAGSFHESAGMLFATFQHSCSRAQDPQLHTHAVAINLTLRDDGSTGSLHSRRLFEQKMRAGEVYRSCLAEGLKARLGLQLEFDKVGFHIVGVPKDLCESFSQRRRQIVQALRKRGESGAVAAKEAAVETRQPKVHTTREELLADWQRIGQSFGWGAQEASRLVQLTKGQVRQDQHQARLNELATSLPAQIARQTSHELVTTGVQSERRQVSAELREVRPKESREFRPARDLEMGGLPTSWKAQGVSEFRQQLQRLSRSNRTRHKVEQIAARIVRTYGTDPGELRAVLKEFPLPRRFLNPGVVWKSLSGQPPWKEPQGKVVSITRKQLFPLAPAKRLREIHVPALAAELPRVVLRQPRPYQPRWWTIRRKWNLGLGELRIQDRNLFPKAAEWNPLHRVRIPAFRLTAHKSKWQPKHREAKPKKASEQKLTMTMGW